MQLVKQLAVLSSLAAALVSPFAEAADATASLDFTHMTVSTYGSLTYSLLPIDGYSTASGNANGVLGDASSWSGGSFSINNAGASVNASLDGGYISMSASATSGSGDGWGYVNWSQVQLSGNGVVVFSIPYSVAVSAHENGASASSQVYASLYGYDGAGRSVGSSNSVNQWAGTGSTEHSDSGMLTLAHYFGGGTGTFSLSGGNYVSASVPAVPEPESYAMFLAGLGIIGAVARRRSIRG